VIGAAAQAVVQVPSVVRAVGRIRVRLELTPELRGILRLYAPVAAGLLVSVAGQILDLHFKSQLVRGGLAAMGFATTLVQFPIGITVAALSFAILPTISLYAATDRMDEFKSTLATGIRLVLFLTVPAALGYIALATPIAGLIYQHGHTGSAGVDKVATALRGYAIQIPFVGVDQLMIFAFYARKNTVTPMLIGILGVAIYVVGALILLPRLHILGLALANTIQNSLHAVILMTLLLAAIGTLEGTRVLAGIGKTLLAGAVMCGGTVLAVIGLTHAVSGHSTKAHAMEVFLPMLLAVTLYVGISRLLRSEDLALVTEIARNRFRRGE
jgi:putative peptidoglycan lipid II flippase